MVAVEAVNLRTLLPSQGVLGQEQREQSERRNRKTRDLHRGLMVISNRHLQISAGELSRNSWSIHDDDFGDDNVKYSVTRWLRRSDWRKESEASTVRM